MSYYAGLLCLDGRGPEQWAYFGFQESHMGYTVPLPGEDQQPPLVEGVLLFVKWMMIHLKSNTPFLMLLLRGAAHLH